MKLRLPRWLATLPFSLALHVVFVAGAIALLRSEGTLPPLVIDLKAIIVGRDDGPGTDVARPPAAAPDWSSRPAKPSPPAQAATPRVTAPTPVPSPPAVSAPAPPPAPQAPPPDAAVRAMEPAPTATATSPTTPVPPIAASDRPPSTSVSGGGVASYASERDGATGERGLGGAARGSGAGGIAAAPGERVAAIAPGTGSGEGAGLGSEYAGYYARLRERIQQSLRYPAVAKRRELTGTVELEIAIAADGAIAAVTVLGSSSHEMLDRAAVDAARSVRRVPFPAGVRPRPLTVRLPVVFNLREVE